MDLIGNWDFTLIFIIIQVLIFLGTIKLRVWILNWANVNGLLFS